MPDTVVSSRNASTPASALARVSVDGIVAHISSFYLLKLAPPELATDVESLSVIFGTALVAYVGKKLRERGSVFGEFI